MYIAVGVVLAALFFCVAAAKLYLVHSGTEEIVVKLTERTPFAVAARDERSVTLVTKMEFANVGKQVGTIMDAFVRPLLPYEQYDGLEVRGRAEREGAPREDDYFEAVLIEHAESIFVKAYVTLTARGGRTLEEAVAHMVDFPAELIYQETGRHPWKYSKVTIPVRAQEVASLVGVTLADD
ncbi:hypothetical protein [uncultured Selenomonas sp.]|uniref:hypothetical protein n=1 Tax=uncultured Selenomonas sp. TaxID=159275 RepID=UPI0028DB6A01|nr:hypothetical protein [uncultured Selenomonas sp.]